MALNLGFIGKKIDQFLPGNQGFLHPNDQPTARPTQVINTINQATGGSPLQRAQAPHGNPNVTYTNPLTAVPKAVVGLPVRMVKNTAQLAVDSAVAPVEEGASIFQKDPATRAAMQADAARRSPIARAGEPLSQAMAGKDVGHNLLRSAGSTVDTVTTATPLIGFGGRQAGESAAKAIVRSAGQNAAYGGVANAASAAANTGDLRETAKAGAEGAAIGAALGGGGTAAAKGIVKGYKAIKPSTTPVTNLKIGTDAMGPIDKATVAKYTSDIKSGKGMEPIVTQKVGNQLYIQDGKHRLAAAKAAGLTDVPTVDKAQYLASQRGSVQVAGKAKVSSKSLPDTLAESVERNKELYAKPTVRQKLAETNNPYNAGVKIDKAFAKASGVPLRDIPKTESLEALAEKSHNSTKIAHAHLTDPASAIGNTIKKYGADTPASRDFNFYRVAMRDLEQRSLGGKPIYNVPEGELADFVAKYEVKNPAARQEITAINREVNALQDKAVEVGHLDPADVEAARATAPNFYTPIQRAVAENVERATMNSQNLGSIGKQGLLQEFKGSHLPVDNSFDSLTGYVQNAYRELSRVELAKKYAERVKAGLAPGRYTDTVENVKGRADIKKQVGEITDTLKDTVKERNKTRVSARVATKDVKLAAKDASTAASRYKKTVTSVKDVINKVTPEGDSKAALSSLSDQDHLKLFKALVEDDTKGIESIRKKLVSTTKVVDKAGAKVATKEGFAQELRTHLDDLRDNVQGLRGVKSQLNRDRAEFTADPTTGLQIVSGRDAGVTFKIETTPEVARFLQGIGDEKLNTVLKAAKTAQTPFRTVFTGVLNPQFAAASATWNAVLAPVVSPQGIRIYGPKAVYESFKSFNKNSQFQKTLSQNGAMKFTGNLETSADISTAKAIADTKNIATRAVFDAKHPVKAFHKLDVIQSKVEGAQRTGIAKAAYDARLRKNGTVEQAISDAVYAYNNVLPNFGRYSSAVRQADALVMYAGASQAGTRALLTAISRDKVGTLAKLGVVSAGLASITAYNYTNDKTQEFYKDMADSKKGYLLDNNIILVSPTAHKDKKTGEWHGITKISIAPELRPINHAVWRTFVSEAEGSGVPLKTYAVSMFDFITGGGRTLSNPAAQLAMSLYSNRNSLNGKEIVPEDYQDLPKDQQKFTSTSKAALEIAKATGQSPIKIDFVIKGLGLAGAAISGAGSDKGVLGTVAEVAGNKYSGAYGKSDVTKYFEDVKRVSSGLEPDDKKAFSALHAKDPTPGIFDSPEKAAIYINRPAVLAADAQLNAANAARGDASNPFFDLTPEQQRAVLNIRVGKYLPGQTYDKNGKSLFVDTGASSFYDDYTKAENAWFKSLGLSDAQMAKSQSPSLTDTPRPTIDQNKMDTYNALPSGTGARTAFLQANPDVLQYFKDNANFTNQQRIAAGLAPVDTAATGNGGYSKFSSGGAAGPGSSRNRSQIAYSDKLSRTPFKKPIKPKVSIKKGSKAKGKVASKSGKTKVSIKKAMV
jgi:viroplasmin and RNaseH domain-containing protein